jgi:hypothetical protein
MLERGRRLALTLDDAIASSQIMDQIEVLPTIGAAITRPSIAIMKNAAIVTLLFPLPPLSRIARRKHENLHTLARGARCRSQNRQHESPFRIETKAAMALAPPPPLRAGLLRRRIGAFFGGFSYRLKGA